MESRKRPPNKDEDSSISERLDKLAEDIKKMSPDRINTLESFVRSMNKKAIPLKDAAELLGCSVLSVRRAIKSGQIKSFQLNVGGNIYIPVEDIERILKGEKLNS